MTPTLRHTPPLTDAERDCLPGATSTRRLRLGTRASELATTQAGWVADLLRSQGHEVELVPVRTEGDASAAPLREIGGTGVFASALRTALLEDRIDVAVHSLKDLPVAPEPGLVVAAVPVREDPRDIVVARDGLALAELPEGAVVGTGSPRRAAQLAVFAPHLQIRDIRGNIDSRVGQVRSGKLDAVVLAAAGLTRVGRLDEVTEVLPLEQMLPAPGQGALAVECREDDEAVIAWCAELDDATTRSCVRAERALLARLEAGCTAPVGAVAVLTGGTGEHAGERGGTMTLTGFADLQGRKSRHDVSGTDPVSLGHQLAEQFLADLATSGTPDPAGAPIAGADHAGNHTTERDT